MLFTCYLQVMRNNDIDLMYGGYAGAAAFGGFLGTFRGHFGSILETFSAHFAGPERTWKKMS